MSKYIYKTSRVASGRKLKSCSACGRTIKVGEPSIKITCFCDEFYAEDVCNSKCETLFREQFSKEEEE